MGSDASNSTPGRGGDGIYKIDAYDFQAMFGAGYLSVAKLDNVTGKCYVAGGGGGGGFQYAPSKWSQGGKGGGGAGADTHPNDINLLKPLSLARDNTCSGGGGAGPVDALLGGDGAAGMLLLRYPVCQPCPAGSFLGGAAAGASACELCPVGTFSTAVGASSSAVCVACGPGTYQATAGASLASACAACGVGAYSTGTQATACALCGAGTFQTGKGMPDPGNCSLCQVGTYSSALGAPNSTLCTDCGAGKYQTGLGMRAASDCINCSLGTFSSGTGRTACSNCSNGTYASVTGLQACVACPGGLGTGGAVGSVSVTSCVCPGELKMDPSQLRCRDVRCGAGTHLAVTDTLSLDHAYSGVNQCRRCGAGSASACPAVVSSNAYPGVGLGGASAGNDGQVDDEANDYDMQYVVGIYTDTDGIQYWRVDFEASIPTVAVRVWVSQSTCYDTQVNGKRMEDCTSKLRNFEMWVGDDPSDPGAAGNVLCYNDTSTDIYPSGLLSVSFPCIARGRYAWLVRSTLLTGPYITPSKWLVFSEVEVYSEVTVMPAFLDRSAECKGCKPGTYSSAMGLAGFWQCSACSAGTFQTGTGLTLKSDCRACVAGSFQTGEGMPAQSNCTLCGPGTFQTGTGMLSPANCTVCGVGTFQTGEGMPAPSNCTACGAGKYQNATGASEESACTPCGTGRYQTGSGMALESNCTSCANGTFTASDRPNQCWPCPNFSTSPARSGSCQCGDGYAGVIRESSETCTGCTLCDPYADTFGVCDTVTRFDNTTCACWEGYYGSGRVCAPCAACDGNATRQECAYNSTNDTSTCTCNEGFWGDGRTCQPCRECSGNATQLQFCLAGSAADVSECACNAGYWGEGRNCTPCRTCDGNANVLQSCVFNSTSDVTACGCLPGYYGDGIVCAACRGCSNVSQVLEACNGSTLADVTACVCLPGYFSPTGFDCQACPQGTWGPGGAYCVGCGRGAYSDQVAQDSNATCLPCPVDTYGPRESSGSLSAACLPCPDYSNTAAEASTNRTQCVCKTGYINSVTEIGGSCQGCNPNQYASEDQATCLSCPPNTASPPGSVGIWQCSANAGFFARYTQTLRMTLEVPEEDADPDLIEAYVKAAVGDGDDVRVNVEF